MTDLQFKQVMNQIFHSCCATLTTLVSYFTASNGVSGLWELIFCIVFAILAFYHCVKIKYISN